jgi:prepilin-type N-terminal cleavage/methylation domain-containing protein
MFSIVIALPSGSFRPKDFLMNSPASPQVNRRAFTLIELLVVISIIAILMGLLFPAIGMIKESARKADAKTTVGSIVAAVKQYQTEYGKFPQVEAAPANASADAFVGDTVAGAKTDNADLFNILRAINDGINQKDKYNPKKIVFFEGKAAADPKSPRGGFAGQNAAKKGSFFDPWGSQFNIVIDSNYDNVIDVGAIYKDFAGRDQPRVSCGAFSTGKDNIIGTKKNPGFYKKETEPSDDVVSWQ